MRLALSRFWSGLTKNRGLINKSGVQMSIGVMRLTGLKLLGTSKAGNCSWSGMLGNTKIKIYQVASPAQACFIQKVTEHPAVSAYFPRVLHRQANFIAAEWIEGLPLDDRYIMTHPGLIDQLASFQAGLHALSFGVDPGFDYLQFLVQRLKCLLGPFDQPPAIIEMLQAVHRNLPEEDARLSHADITPRNLVLDRVSGTIKSIDNELLSQGSYYPLDVFNTYYSIGTSLQTGYINAYLDRNIDAGRYLVKHKDFIKAAWTLRLMGSSMLLTGNFDPIFNLMDEISNTLSAMFNIIEMRMINK